MFGCRFLALVCYGIKTDEFTNFWRSEGPMRRPKPRNKSAKPRGRPPKPLEDQEILRRFGQPLNNLWTYFAIQVTLVPNSFLKLVFVQLHFSQTLSTWMIFRHSWVFLWIHWRIFGSKRSTNLISKLKLPSKNLVLNHQIFFKIFSLP